MITSKMRLVFITQPSDGLEGQSLGNIQVAVEDPYGNILTDEDTSVTLNVWSPSASPTTAMTLTPDSQGTSIGTSLPGLVGTTTVATQNGIATFTDLSLDDPGTFSLLASVPLSLNVLAGTTNNSTYPLDAISSDFTLTVVGRHLVFTSQPPNTLPGVVIQSFSVAVEDTFGTILGDDASSITLTAQAAPDNPGGNPVVQGTLTQAVNNGVATFNDLSLTSSGFYEFSASDDGADSALSNSFIVYTPYVPIPTTLPSVGTVASFTGDESDVHDGLVMDSHGNFYGVSSQSSGAATATGAIFEIPAGGSATVVLATFNSSTPDRSDKLVIDSKGNLYGTTSGGIAGDGTIFELPKGSHTIETLVTFTGSNGSTPGGYLAIDAAGDLFGATTSGGANNLGTIFELHHGTQVVQTLISLNSADDFSLAQGLLLDKQGNLYGVTGGGYTGTSSSGELVELPKGGHILKSLASFTELDGNDVIGPLAMDANNDIFGVMALGGANGEGAVFELAKGSHILKSISFSHNEGSPDGGLALDKSGNLFGSTFDGIYEVNAGFDGITYVATLAEGTVGAVPTGSLTASPNGMLYGVDISGGLHGAGGVFSLNPATLPAKILIQQQPAATVTNGAVSLKVAVLDAKGKVVTSGSYSLTLILQKGPGTSAADFIPITVSTVNGIATFSDISLPATAGTYQFQISEGLLKPVISHGAVVKKAVVKAIHH
jgi:uncharacterized repeat protein (TIGR03803 family)